MVGECSPGIESGWSGGVVAATAAGEDAFDDHFEAGRTYGQGLDVLVQAGQTVADVGRASSSVRREAVDVGAKASDAILRILTQAADFRDYFVAASAEVATQVVPLRHLEDSQTHAHDQGCDELG